LAHRRILGILLGWLAAWTIVALTRWVRRGFVVPV
jgi:hypothetical protein